MIGFVIALVAASGKVSAVDSDYLQKVAEDNIAELKISKMVRAKTRDPQVKKACDLMLKDHSNQYQRVQNIARTLDISLPTEPSPTHKALYQQMSAKSGKDLDKSFTAVQLQDHINDVNEAQEEAELGQAGEVKEFARDAVKSFAKHEHVWRGVAKTLGVNPTFGRPSAEQILAGHKVAD